MYVFKFADMERYRQAGSEKMDNHYNIYICGVGGQGIIKTSTIIGEAAMNQGLDVVMSEIHGMSQRGGSVSTELKIGGYNSSIIPNEGADMLLSVKLKLFSIPIRLFLLLVIRHILVLTL